MGMKEFVARCEKSADALKYGVVLNRSDDEYLVTRGIKPGTVIQVDSQEDSLIFIRNADLVAAGGKQVIDDPNYAYSFVPEDYEVAYPKNNPFYHWNRLKQSRDVGALQSTNC